MVVSVAIFFFFFFFFRYLHRTRITECYRQGTLRPTDCGLGESGPGDGEQEQERLDHVGYHCSYQAQVGPALLPTSLAQCI